MPWKYDVPEDLRHRLEGAMSARSCGPAEVWAEVVDWLNQQEVEPPAGCERPAARK